MIKLPTFHHFYQFLGQKEVFLIKNEVFLHIFNRNVHSPVSKQRIRSVGLNRAVMDNRRVDYS